jgi:uncharacterized protein YbcI
VEKASELFSSIWYHDIASPPNQRPNLVTAWRFQAARLDGEGNETRWGKAMKSQGEIEAAVCEGISRFEQEYMGRGPKDVHAHLIGDLIGVRLHGVLTAAEQQLVKSLSPEKGRDLLKQVRTQLIETARPVLETLVSAITCVKVSSLHHDISTVTGEEVVLFALAESPLCRETKKKQVGTLRRAEPV